jgi:hypothetical protein
MIDISICIPTYNNKHILYNCLKSIFDKTKGITIEVIVCDDSSVDGTAGMLAADFPEVRLVKNQIRQGYTKTINRAIREARGDKILLLNNDTVFIDNPLSGLNDYLIKHAETGAVTCKMLNIDGSLQRGFNVRRFPDLWYMLWEALMLDRIFPKQFLTRHFSMLDFNPDLLQEVDQPAATFLLVRKTVLKRIGLLDENLPNFYNDVDLCLRIRKAGWKIVYHPGASIYHHGGGSYLLLPKKDAMLNNYRDRFAFVHKHFGLGSLTVLKTVLMIGMIIRILSFLGIFYLVKYKLLSLKNVTPANSWEAIKSYKGVLELCLR